MDQLVQIVGGGGVVGVDMRHFRIGLPVDQMVQQVDYDDAQGNGTDDHGKARIGFNSLGDQVKAHDAQHNAAGKTQQQADGTVGVLLEQRADQAAQTGSRNTGNGRC